MKYPLAFVGMVNYKALISKKLQIDLVKNKFMSGAAVMISLPQMEKAWRCVLRELLLISKIRYSWQGHFTLIGRYTIYLVSLLLTVVVLVAMLKVMS